MGPLAIDRSRQVQRWQQIRKAFGDVLPAARLEPIELTTPRVATTHHLLCPCHQSTFDLTHECEVIFGPASRPLPQLPIEVDADGYLVATSDFHEPVGPSYWEREYS